MKPEAQRNRRRIQRQHNIEVLTRQLHITEEQAAKLLDSKLQPVKHDPILIHHEHPTRTTKPSA